MRSFKLTQISEQAFRGMVDEVDQFVAGDTLGIGRPIPPLELLGDDRLVAVANELQFLVFLIENFQEKHPAELLKPLGIAGDAAILPHDVADVLNDGGNVGHIVYAAVL